MSDLDLSGIREKLLAWYDTHQRRLPWRTDPGSSPDPYRVWLSEVMLQQTRVETVKAYFDRWLERFPDLETLAAADQDQVLKLWEGLGYYARARNFHRAVREVAERYGGEVPDDPDAFRALPGVGPYTAGAVMSIAFDREEPVVDGNVRRVLARLLDEGTPGDRQLWNAAGRLVKGERPGDLNQALMELGAIVCTPRAPRCGHCPLAGSCRARAAGTVAERPLPKRRPPLPVERVGVAVIEGPDGVIVRKRPEAGRLGGMWEFPGAELAPGESALNAAERALTGAAALTLPVLEHLGTVPHTFTHVKVVYEAYYGTTETRRRETSADVEWVTRERLAEYALPRAQQKIASLLPPLAVDPLAAR